MTFFHGDDRRERDIARHTQQHDVQPASLGPIRKRHEPRDNGSTRIACIVTACVGLSVRQSRKPPAVAREHQPHAFGDHQAPTISEMNSARTRPGWRCAD